MYTVRFCEHLKRAKCASVKRKCLEMAFERNGELRTPTTFTASDVTTRVPPSVRKRQHT